MQRPFSKAQIKRRMRLELRGCLLVLSRKRQNLRQDTDQLHSMAASLAKVSIKMLQRNLN
jgi:hypothetical protein